MSGNGSFEDPFRVTGPGGGPPLSGAVDSDLYIDPRSLGQFVPGDDAFALLNTASLNAALAEAHANYLSGEGPTKVLMPGGKYWVGGTVQASLSGVSLVGMGIGKTTLYMPASRYTNTVLAAHDSSSMLIDASGELSGSFTPARNIALRGFTIESEYSDGRVLFPVRCSNVRNLVIEEVEVFGIPVGTLIEVNTIGGASSISGCYLRNSGTSLITYSSQPQLTGIEVDNYKVDGNPSVGLDIHDNRIEELQFSGLALTGDPGSYGMQTDGVNTHGGTGLLVHHNFIIAVGEGIDCFANDCLLSDNVLINCYHAGIKLIHGASRNEVCDNLILRPGRAGVVMEGRSGNTDDNFVHGNRIHDVNSDNAWSGLTNAAFLVVSGAGIEANRNTIRDNKVTGGTYMKYVVCNEAGSDNRFFDNEAEGFSVAYSLVSGGTARIRNGDELSWQPLAQFPSRSKITTIELVEHFTSVAAMRGLTAATSGTASGLTDEPSDAGGRVGIADLRTGTDATGRAALVSFSTALRLGAGRHRLRWDLFPTALSDGTNTYVSRVGFIDSASGESTNGVFFRYTHSVNGGRWQAVTRAAGVETATDTGVAATAAWAFFEVEVNAAGTSAAFYLNGALVATNTTNIPTATQTGFGTAHIKSAGTANREFRVDMMAYSFEPTTPL